MTTATEKSTAGKSAEHAADPHTFVTCIDLPGQSVQCWRTSTKKVKVILRKHRDVIFNIELFKGMMYTVHAEHSEFYDTRSKKIVFKGEKVTFQDGEQVHFWVSREFKGALVLKANGKQLGRYEPMKLDPVCHDAEPSTKPAPLIVILQNQPAENEAPVAKPQPKSIYPVTPMLDNRAVINSLHNSHIPAYVVPDASGQETMHIVEIKLTSDLPREVADFFKHGGEETAIDPAKIMSLNWLWAQIGGIGAYVNDNWEWIKELKRKRFFLKKIMHSSGPKWYVIFQGGSQVASEMNVWYSAAHTKILALTGGAGSIVGMRHAAWASVSGAVQKAGRLCIFLTIALDTAEWLNDYEQRDPKTGLPKKDLFDLFYKIGLDFGKALMSAALSTVIIGSLITLLSSVVVIPLLFSVGSIIIGTIVLSIIIGYSIDYFDKKFGVTDKLNIKIRENAKKLIDIFPADYGKYSSAIEQVIAYGSMGA